MVDMFKNSVRWITLDKVKKTLPFEEDIKITIFPIPSHLLLAKWNYVDPFVDAYRTKTLRNLLMLDYLCESRFWSRNWYSTDEMFEVFKNICQFNPCYKSISICDISSVISLAVLSLYVPGVAQSQCTGDVKNLLITFPQQKFKVQIKPELLTSVPFSRVNLPHTYRNKKDRHPTCTCLFSCSRPNSSSRKWDSISWRNERVKDLFKKQNKQDSFPTAMAMVQIHLPTGWFLNVNFILGGLISGLYQPHSSKDITHCNT